MKNKKMMLMFCSVMGLTFCSCGGNSSNTYSNNEYVENSVVTSETYRDGNGEISFRGAPMKTVWKNKYRLGHQFRATIKSGHNVVSTTKCDYCGHTYYVHNDKQ